MTRDRKIAHAIQKLAIARRLVKEAETDLRRLTKPESTPKPAGRASDFEQVGE